MQWQVQAVLCILFSVLISQPAISAPFWEAELAANSSLEFIPVKDDNGKLHAVINRNAILALRTSKNKVENAAGHIRATYLIDGEMKPNAFATFVKGQPIIAINLGMIQLLNEDEEAYAALVAHELAHLYLKHSEKHALKNGLKQVGSLFLGLVLVEGGVPAGGIIADISTTAISTVFSREDERAADVEGMKYIIGAGYDPYGAMRLQEKLASIEGATIPFLSSHPSGKERVANMSLLAAAAKADHIGISKHNELPVFASSVPDIPILPEALATPKKLDISLKLRELKKLYGEGIISKDDLDNKRKMLLNEL